jgi:hypothetical protein
MRARSFVASGLNGVRGQAGSNHGLVTWTGGVRLAGTQRSE